jgi:hypothetical protein
MASKIEQSRIGNTTYSLYYRMCDKCGKSHDEQSYITEDGKELCAKCELERIGKFPKRKIYIIDGDNDRIIAVFHKTGNENFNDAVKAITQNKEVWWAMNNVTGKFSANVYIVSNELNGK